MTMRLFRVDYSGHGYVVASSPEAAVRTVRLSLPGHQIAGVEVSESEPGVISPEWCPAYPLGEHRDRTCSTWAKEQS
jgi:hypothetical protein